MFKALKAQHEQQGTFTQINLLLKGLQTEFTYKKSICDMVSKMRTYYQRIAAMGQLKLNDIFSILLNGMNRHFGPLQQTIHSLSSNNSNYNSALIKVCLFNEDALIKRHVELGQPTNPYTLSPSVSTLFAFAAVAPHSCSPHLVCTNCKCDTHTTDYYIAPRGKMAGQTIDEACAAQHAARPYDNLSLAPGMRLAYTTCGPG
jgi:hypothetical protein